MDQRQTNKPTNRFGRYPITAVCYSVNIVGLYVGLKKKV